MQVNQSHISSIYRSAPALDSDYVSQWKLWEQISAAFSAVGTTLVVYQTTDLAALKYAELYNEDSPNDRMLLIFRNMKTGMFRYVKLGQQTYTEENKAPNQLDIRDVERYFEKTTYGRFMDLYVQEGVVRGHPTSPSERDIIKHMFREISTDTEKFQTEALGVVLGDYQERLNAALAIDVQHTLPSYQAVMGPCVSALTPSNLPVRPFGLSDPSPQLTRSPPPLPAQLNCDPNHEMPSPA